ncbi:uncharacterized protein METZ01_LOCUS355899, partial [marine metagenome]
VRCGLRRTELKHIDHLGSVLGSAINTVDSTEASASTNHMGWLSSLPKGLLELAHLTTHYRQLRA